MIVYVFVAVFLVLMILIDKKPRKLKPRTHGIWDDGSVKSGYYEEPYEVRYN